MSGLVHPEEDAPAQRFDFAAVAPAALAAMESLQRYVDACGLDHTLLELVKQRCSQLNGCAFCTDLHARRLRQAGVSNQKIDAIAVWRESPLFTREERAALAWGESVTLVSADHVPDEVYHWVSRYFSGKALADLTLAVVAINGWNRLSVCARRDTPVERRQSSAG